MRTGIRRPDPTPPRIDVFCEGLSSGALEQCDEARAGTPQSEAMEFEQYGGMGVVPPVQNCSLCDLRLRGAAQQVEKHLGIRRLRCKGRWQQEQE
jgi:hypothetical protein